MKAIIPPFAVVAAAVLAIIPTARAEMSPFRVRVEQVSKSETEKYSKTQKRSLKIFVSNGSKEPVELIAKYWFFGRELKGKDVLELDKGEKPVSTKAMGTEMVESAVVSAESEEEHYAGGGSSKGRSSAGKKTEASGTKILGYAVQVFQGTKMVAETYEPLSMKEQVGKAYPAKLPTAPKKK